MLHVCIMNIDRYKNASETGVYCRMIRSLHPCLSMWPDGRKEPQKAHRYMCREIALKTEASCSLIWELLTGSSQTHFPLFHGQAEVRGGGGGTVRNFPPGRPVRAAFSPPLTESRPRISVPCTSAAPSAARTGPWSGAEAGYQLGIWGRASPHLCPILGPSKAHA